MKETNEVVKRITQLENALKIIATWAHCDDGSPRSRAVVMKHIEDNAINALKDDFVNPPPKRQKGLL